MAEVLSYSQPLDAFWNAHAAAAQHTDDCCDEACFTRDCTHHHHVRTPDAALQFEWKEEDIKVNDVLLKSFDWEAERVDDGIDFPEYDTGAWSQQQPVAELKSEESVEKTPTPSPPPRPRERAASSPPRRKHLPTLLPPSSTATPPRPRDDHHLRSASPRRQVDYLSHPWSRPSLHASYAHLRHHAPTAHPHAHRCPHPAHAAQPLKEHARLANALWRAWGQDVWALGRESPERLGWRKDSDVTWLYGPYVHVGEEEEEQRVVRRNAKRGCLKYADARRDEAWRESHSRGKEGEKEKKSRKRIRFHPAAARVVFESGARPNLRVAPTAVEVVLSPPSPSPLQSLQGRDPLADTNTITNTNTTTTVSTTTPSPPTRPALHRSTSYHHDLATVEDATASEDESQTQEQVPTPPPTDAQCELEAQLDARVEHFAVREAALLVDALPPSVRAFRLDSREGQVSSPPCESPGELFPMDDVGACGEEDEDEIMAEGLFGPAGGMAGMGMIRRAGTWPL